MTVAIAKWSLEDYHQMLEMGLLRDRQVELLNGEIIEMPPEGPDHAQLNTDGADYLRSLLGEQALIRDAKPITLPNSSSEPQPDIAIVKPQRERYRQRHPYSEDIFLLIEYAKTSLLKDLEDKHRTYAAAGVLEYWVVDLQHRQIKIFREPQDEDYQSGRTLTNGAIRPLAFPEISVSVRHLL